MKFDNKTYLLAVTACLFAVGCTETTSPAPRFNAAKREPSSAHTNASKSSPDVEQTRLPGMGCLVNEFGVRRKAIVTRQNVRASDAPGGMPAGLPLRYFFPYYIFRVHKAGGSVFHYQIGSTPREESIAGWVRISDCAIWDHRIAARINRTPGVRLPPLLIYENKDSLVEYLKTGRTSDDPIARASLSGYSSRTWMPWPIIEVARVELNGTIHEMYKLAFLGEVKAGGEITESDPDASAAAAYSADEIHSIQQGVKMLDVAFVMDATGSMQEYFDAAKRTVSQMAEQLQNLDVKPSVAFSLTAYRDHDRDSRFATRHFDLTPNAESFITQMNTIKADQGGDTAEAVYDGILDSLEKTSWRGNGLSARIIILVGDCPAHEASDPQNPRNITPERLIKSADQAGVKIFGLAVGSKDGNDAYRRRWRQFSRLAEGTGGTCVTIDDAASVIQQIRDVLNTEAAVVHDRAFVVEQLASGKSESQIVAQNVVDIREFTELMEFLAKAGVDVEKLTGRPTFATGWCLATPGGISVLNKEIYIARSELEVLTSELNQLCVSLGADFGQNVAEIGFLGRVDPRSWFGQSDGGPLDIWLAKQGIPTSSGILKLTKTDMDHMSEESRGRLREDIMRHYLPRLVNLRNDDSIFAPIDDLEWGFVPEDSLP